MVLHLAANVGGIGYNRRNPGPLANDNLAMGLNVFEACRELGAEKLVAACSVCAYPKITPVPFSEENIWDGYPEESNAPYGLAKKMLLVLSDAYRRQYGLDSCAPVMANLYGPGDNFDLEDSHVIAAMVHKYVLAAERGDPEVVLWGTGKPSREFLYVDDAARALVLCAEKLDVSDPVNIGTGKETSIRELAETIAGARRLRGEDRLGRLPPGRAAEALPRREPGEGADRLRGRDGPGRGLGPDDRVVPRRRSGHGRLLRLTETVRGLASEITSCTRCPRLVEWRERCAAEPPRRYRGERYWARPLPGFGDARAPDRGGRAGAGGPRRQPDRPGLHRRSLGRLAVRRAPPSRTRQPADLGEPR